MFAGRVKIVSHLSCSTSAIFKYFCPLGNPANSVDLDQLVSEKPADLDLHFFKTGYFGIHHGKI